MSAPLAKILHKMQELLRNLVSALETFILFPSIFRTSQGKGQFKVGYWRRRSLAGFAEEISILFTAPLSLRRMMIMSDKMREQFKASLQSSTVCMLPSYTYALPSGVEAGTYLALDVGGSTFRVSLIELRGRGNMEALRVSTSYIDEDVKKLEGTLFFDWMAEKIDSMLHEVGENYGRESTPLSMGLSWSFPIEQTSVNSGLLIHMGKGFMCSMGTVGQELSDLIIQSCRNRGLNVQVDAIVNDSSAALLSRAYGDPKTRMSLILGTGTNVAIHYPVNKIGLSKFGTRPKEWFSRARQVIVNSEMSMFGGGVLPMTRWDDYLNRTHLRPDYQPLEYMTTGRYLGEIVRLILVEAVETARLFDGQLPHSMRDPYTLDTSIVACLEADTSSSLSSSSALLQKEHNFHISPSLEDLRFMRHVCQMVSQRAAGYLAIAIHSMWCLRNDAEFPQNSADSAKGGVSISENEQSRSLSIACDGSVINKYPGFRDRCQSYVNQLAEQTNLLQGYSDPASGPHISLEPAAEGAIFGAAVAVAVAVAEKTSA